MKQIENDSSINAKIAINILKEIYAALKDHKEQKELKNENMSLILNGLYSEIKDFLFSLPHLTPNKLLVQVEELNSISKKFDKRNKISVTEKLEISEKFNQIKQRLKIDSEGLSITNEMLSNIFLAMSELDFSKRLPLLTDNDFDQHNFLAIALNRTNELIEEKINSIVINERNRINTFFELTEKTPIVISTDIDDKMDFISDGAMISFNFDIKKILDKPIELLLKRFNLIKIMLTTEGGIQGLPVEFNKSLGVNYKNKAILSARPRLDSEGAVIGYLYYIQPTLNFHID